MNGDDGIVTGLQMLGLNGSEATIYTELLKSHATHAQLSQRTGINRTTLYRLVASLEKRGLVTLRTDDVGKFLVASDPSTLETDVITQEQQSRQQREIFTRLLPTLEHIKKRTEADFALHTYEGIEGFKRMLWHELKTKGECLCYGVGTLEDVVPDHRWVEMQRQKNLEAGYTLRELLNTPIRSFTNVEGFTRGYQQRCIDATILPMNHMITIYNDTVATYNVYEGRRIGLEIVSKTYANTMRQVFEQFWILATPTILDGQE
jgi:predicted DNA-binding transcriptional regulator